MSVKNIRNKAYVMAHGRNRKKLYKSGKLWLVASATFLALMGGTSLATYADTIQQNSNNHNKQSIELSQNNKNQLNKSTSANNITKQADLLYSNLQNSNSNYQMNKNNSVSDSSNAYNTVNIGTPKQQANRWNYVQKGINNHDYDTQHATTSSTNNFSMTRLQKPIKHNLLASAPTSNQNIQTGTYGAATYKFDKSTGTLEFTKGQIPFIDDDHDQSGFVPYENNRHNGFIKNIEPSDVKALIFDSDVTYQSDYSISGFGSLQYLDLSHVKSGTNNLFPLDFVISGSPLKEVILGKRQKLHISGNSIIHMSSDKQDRERLINDLNSTSKNSMGLTNSQMISQFTSISPTLLKQHLENDTDYLISNDCDDGTASNAGSYTTSDLSNLIQNGLNQGLLNISSDITKDYFNSQYIYSAPQPEFYRKDLNDDYTSPSPTNILDNQSHPGIWLSSIIPTPNYQSEIASLTSEASSEAKAISDDNTIINSYKAQSASISSDDTWVHNNSNSVDSTNSWVYNNLATINSIISTYNTTSNSAKSAMSSLTNDSAELSWLANSESALSTGSSQANSNAQWISNNSASVSSLSSKWTSVDSKISSDSSALNTAIQTKANQTSLDNDYSTLSGDITKASGLANKANQLANKNNGEISDLKKNTAITFTFTKNDNNHEAHLPITLTKGYIEKEAQSQKGNVYDITNLLNDAIASSSQHVVGKYTITVNSDDGTANLQLNQPNRPHHNLGLHLLGATDEDTIPTNDVKVIGNNAEYKGTITLNFGNQSTTINYDTNSNGQNNSDVISGNSINLLHFAKNATKPSDYENDKLIKDFDTTGFNFTNIYDDKGNKVNSDIYKFIISPSDATNQNGTDVHTINFTLNYQAYKIPTTINYIFNNDKVAKNEGSIIISDLDDTHSNWNKMTGLNSDWHLAQPSTPFTYTNNGTVNINVLPNQATDTIQYVDGNKHSINYNKQIGNSQKFTGNIAKGTVPNDVGNTTFDVNTAQSIIPSGYEPQNSSNIFNYDGKTHTVYIIGVSHKSYTPEKATTNPKDKSNVDNEKHSIATTIIKQYINGNVAHSDVNTTDESSLITGDSATLYAPTIQGYNVQNPSDFITTMKSDGSLSNGIHTFKYVVNSDEIAPIQITFKNQNDQYVNKTTGKATAYRNDATITITPNDLAKLGAVGDYVNLTGINPTTHKNFFNAPKGYHFANHDKSSVENNTNQLNHIQLQQKQVSIKNPLGAIRLFAVLPKGTIKPKPHKVTPSKHTNKGSIPSFVPSQEMPQVPSDLVKALETPKNTESNKVVVPTNTTQSDNTPKVPTRHIKNLNKLSQLYRMSVGNVANFKGYRVAKLNNVKWLRYVKAIRPILLHLNPVSVGHVKDYAYNLKPKLNKTLTVRGVYIFKKGNSTAVRFLINFHHKNYFITSNPKYVVNSYLPLTLRMNGRHVHVFRTVYEYKHLDRGFRGVLRKGHTVRIKRIKRLGKFNRTRIQLSNGRWITANLNFISLVD